MLIESGCAYGNRWRRSVSLAAKGLSRWPGCRRLCRADAGRRLLVAPCWPGRLPVAGVAPGFTCALPPASVSRPVRAVAAVRHRCRPSLALAPEAWPRVAALMPPALLAALVALLGWS